MRNMLMGCILGFVVLLSAEMQHLGSSTFQYPLLGFIHINVYDIHYYQGHVKEDLREEKAASPLSSERADNHERLVLVYKRKVKKKHSLKGWEAGLKPYLEARPQLREKAQWIYRYTLDMEKGDVFTITRQNSDLRFEKNGTLIATTQDPDLAYLAFAPWVGESPIDKELKQELLKNSLDKE